VLLLNGDCLEEMQKLIDDGVQVDSVVTDPPYHLTSITERFGKEGSAPAQYGTDGAFARASKGFMGKEWDGGDIAFRKETWGLALKLLKPGGHLLAFSGSRTYHRMAVAIEDAGFEIRDQIMWLYGSGFPKSLNIGKAIDKKQGNKRFTVGERTRNVKPFDDDNGWNSNNTTGNYIYTKGNTQYEGWGTALKPAHEPIVLARKPISEKSITDNVLKHETGGINIDGCRIEGKVKRPDTNPDFKDVAKKAMAQGGQDKLNFNQISGAERKPAHEPIVLARKPLSEKSVADNVLKHETGGINIDDCRIELSEGDDPRLGGEGSWKTDKMAKDVYVGGYAGKDTKSNELGRFPANVMHDGLQEDWARYFYCPKTSKAERGELNTHPTVKPKKLMQYLCRLVTPKNGTVLDLFMGSGSTGIAAKDEGFDFIGIEKDKEYFEIAEARIKSSSPLMDCFE